MRILNRFKQKKIISSLLIIFIIVILYILYYNIEEYENYQDTIQKRTLEKDGFCVLYDPKYSIETKDYPCEKLKNDVLNLLPPGYVFIDYFYKINNISLSTFHRDVTSSQHIFNTKHTVYTLILYKYDGDLLSICPGSNKTYPFVTSRILNVEGNSGTVFLFDSDVLHAGRINNCMDREVLQYKICHKDDLPKLKNLVGVYKEKTEKCVNSLYVKIMRKISYYFEMPINYFAYPLMIKRENNNLIGFIQSFIPMSYYNN
jgi:hypothetical protein